MPDCGCRIEQASTGAYIDYCRLHAAAPLLAEALRATEDAEALADRNLTWAWLGVIARRYQLDTLGYDQALATLQGSAAEMRQAALRAAGLT